MKIATPTWIKSPPCSQQIPSKSWGPVKSPSLFEKLVGGSNPPAAERGGCTLPLFNNFECMFITVNLVFFLKLRTLWTTLYLSLLLLIKNSFIRGSKKFEILYNYLEAYSEPGHLSNIERFVIGNQWQALNIFAKTLHLVYFIGLWMFLCVLLNVYIMAKKLRLGKLIDDGVSTQCKQKIAISRFW